MPGTSKSSVTLGKKGAAGKSWGGELHPQCRTTAGLFLAAENNRLSRDERPSTPSSIWTPARFGASVGSSLLLTFQDSFVLSLWSPSYSSINWTPCTSSQWLRVGARVFKTSFAAHRWAKIMSDWASVLTSVKQVLGGSSNPESTRNL